MTLPYFAYGSNLEHEDWCVYCRRHGLLADGLKPLHPAIAPDHSLAFTRYSQTRGGGVLDILQSRGSAVSGMLYRVCEETLAALDHKEGVPHAYERVPITVLDADGAEISAFTYRVAPERRERFVQPHPDYLAVCTAGRAAFGIDATILDEAAAGRPAGMIHTAFVYGTLMQGERGDRFWTGLRDRPAIRPARVPGILKDCGPYPGLVGAATRDGANETIVRGELLAFPDIGAILDAFDAYEDFAGYGERSNVYRRIPVTARPEDGDETAAEAPTAITAWAYLLLDHAEFPAIPGGCWRSHRQAL